MVLRKASSPLKALAPVDRLDRVAADVGTVERKHLARRALEEHLRVARLRRDRHTRIGGDSHCCVEATCLLVRGGAGLLPDAMLESSDPGIALAALLADRIGR